MNKWIHLKKKKKNYNTTSCVQNEIYRFNGHQSGAFVCMLTQSSFLRLRPLSTHGLASKRPAAKFLGLILFEPKKSVKKFKVRTPLPTQCPHTSTVTFGAGVFSNIITSSCAWLSGARHCPRHGKPCARSSWVTPLCAWLSPKFFQKP